MDGQSDSQIEIFRPFGQAFELMKRILFQPFDIKKWFVIGFAAWLATLGEGIGYNYQRGSGAESARQPLVSRRPGLHPSNPNVDSHFGVGADRIIFFALFILFAWLRARGRFMFADCVVKNRAAIVEPWREFRELANSYFLFSLLVSCGLFIIMGGLSLPFLLPFIRGVTLPHLHDFYLISMFALWGVVFLLLSIVWGLIAHVMVVMMYRRRCRAVEGFRAAVSLIFRYPGEITLYCVFWIVLLIGMILAACILMCATCCLALLPYLGAVILLPVHIWLRGFGLLFFRQFGPDCDAWGGAPPIPSGPPPLPPVLPATT